MSQSTVTVVVNDAATPTEAVTLAKTMLEPYGHNSGTYRVIPVPDAEVEHILTSTQEDALARTPLDEITTDPLSRGALIDAIGEYMTGNPDNGYWDSKSGYGYHASAGRWDSHQLGGYWRGFYEMKPGTPTSDYLLGQESAFNSIPDEALRGRADAARKGTIDIDSMRLMAEVEASAFYDRYEAATEGLEAPESWEKTLAHRVSAVLTGVRADALVSSGRAGQVESLPQSVLPALPGDIDALPDAACMQWVQDIHQTLHDKSMLAEAALITTEVERLRPIFSQHPWIRAVVKERLVPMFASPHETFRVGSGGREALVRERGEGVLVTHALLTEDGWMERGRMGALGLSDDVMTRQEWTDVFSARVEALSDDAWLVVMDLHC